MKHSQHEGQAVELHAECLKALAGMQSVAVYDKDSTLFHQGQPARGVYILQSGHARLMIEPSADTELPFRVAGPGYLLGLPSTIANEPYNFTAKLLEKAKVGFIHRDDLLPFLRNDRELCFHVVQMLGQEVDSAFGVIRAVRRGQPLAVRSIA